MATRLDSFSHFFTSSLSGQCVSLLTHSLILYSQQIMWYGKHLRRLRKARQVLKRQQQQLLDLELEGLVAITLHSVSDRLTITMEHEVIMQAVDLLREGLRDRRKQLKTEAKQLRYNWSETEALQDHSAQRSQSVPGLSS